MNRSAPAPTYGSRRSLCRSAIASFVALIPLYGSPAMARGDIIIGVSAPMSDYFEILGEQIEIGTRAAIDADSGYSLATADDECSAEGGAASAEQLIAAGAEVVIGYPCIEAFNAAMPILAEEGIPVIAVGLQADGVTADLDKTGWPLVRLAARSSDEASAAAAYLKQAWRQVNYAVIDDGTLYGREFAEAVRFSMEEDNLRPVFTDTYRPQLENQVALVRRLQKSGATHVIVGGDAFDAAIIARDAKKIGINLTLAGGSAFVAPPGEGRLGDGTIVIARPKWADQPPARKAIAALNVADETAEGYTIPAYAAAEVATTALGAGASGQDLYEQLKNQTFDTAIGPIRFGQDGELTRNLFKPFIMRDGTLIQATGRRGNATQ